MSWKYRRMVANTSVRWMIYNFHRNELTAEWKNVKIHLYALVEVEYLG